MMTTTQLSERQEEASQRAVEDAAQLPPKARERIREDLCLQFAYPGRYVASVDAWTEEEPSRRILRRVGADAPTLAELHERLALVAGEARTGACLTYVLDPEGEL